MKISLKCFNHITGKIPFLLIAIASWQCTMPLAVQTSIPTYPSHPLNPQPENLIIANTFDVSSKSFRDNKEKQFMVLTGHTMRHASMQIEKRSDIDVDVVEGPIYSAHPDSVRLLMAQRNATHAILITSFDAYFEQTRVEVTKDENGKSKLAYYDLVVDIGYIMQNQDRIISDVPVSMRKFHSSRSVMSGLLAAGPNIVSNTDDVVDGVHANVDLFLKEYFPGSEPRTRPLFVTREFKDVGTSIKAGNYQGAFDVSERLTSAPNIDVSAKALYNCAVLSEYFSKHDIVRYYLEEALNKQSFMEAREMLHDYR